MTYAPEQLRALGTYWTTQGGVNLGIVGDARHVVGYHCGKDRIYGPNGRGDEDYSVQQPRDKWGLTDAAAAIDLGRLDGSLDNLYAFSNWLVAACQAGDIGSADVREIIYSPDGELVQRWSGVDGKIHTGPGNGDASHLQHTHISYFRDSEERDKLTLFAPYFEGNGDVALDVPANLTSGWRVHLTPGVQMWNDAECTDKADKVSVEQDAVYIGKAGIARCVKVLTGGDTMGVYVRSDDVPAPVRVADPIPEPPEEPIAVLVPGLYRVE
jgi:hypothetical protein